MATNRDADAVNGPAFHVAVFGRAPVEGHVKTRLIPALGPVRATEVYRQLVLRTLATVRNTCRDCAATASLWIADDAGHPDVRRWAAEFGLPVFPQQGDDLGERMLHCLQSLCPAGQKVLLIGTDCPALQASDLEAAAQALNAGQHWVFTPAEDGGYVLVGSNAPSAAPFAGIAWSTGRVMAQTRAGLVAISERWAEMSTHWDVDKPSDVARAEALGLLGR